MGGLVSGISSALTAPIQMATTLAGAPIQMATTPFSLVSSSSNSSSSGGYGVNALYGGVDTTG
jgi:hypothetical protein